METNHSEKLMNQCVEALRQIVATEAENANEITIEVTHLDVLLYQPVSDDFTLEDLRAMKSDVQKLGMKWVDRVQRVRWRELGARKHFFYYDARLYGKERQYVKFIFGLSPFNLLHYLETCEKHQEHEAKSLDEGVFAIYTLDGRGLIPIGATLEYRHDDLRMVGTDMVGGRPVHPLTVTLMNESEMFLQQATHRRWVLTEDFGGVLYLKPAD